MCAKCKLMFPSFCKTLSLTGLKHPQTVPIFICTLASKWSRLLVPLSTLFRLVTSNLYVEYPWAQSSLALRLLALASMTSGLGLDNAVLKHIPGNRLQFIIVCWYVTFLLRHQSPSILIVTLNITQCNE